MINDKKVIIDLLENFCVSNENGLPEDIFLMFSRHIPIINIDLFISDEKSRILLSWRDDEYCGQGWHIPGGIVKHKESIEQCINRVAQREIGTNIEYLPMSPFICEHIESQKTRGHFISLLFKGFLSKKYILPFKDKKPGYLKWYNSCPNNIINVHSKYKNIINDITSCKHAL
jgi:colanic acid biosynthesis protein WcaH